PRFLATQGYVDRVGSFVDTVFIDSRILGPARRPRGPRSNREAGRLGAPRFQPDDRPAQLSVDPDGPGGGVRPIEGRVTIVVDRRHVPVPGPPDRTDSVWRFSWMLSVPMVRLPLHLLPCPRWPRVGERPADDSGSGSATWRSGSWERRSARSWSVAGSSDGRDRTRTSHPRITRRSRWPCSSSWSASPFAWPARWSASPWDEWTSSWRDRREAALFGGRPSGGAW